MQHNDLAIALRPRPMYEATDLGVRLTQAHAGSLWRCYAPLWAAVTLVALSTATIDSWVPWFVVFMAKPWLDRTLLFVFSRAAFGERTRWADLWQAQRGVWWRGLWASLTVQRLSAWRSYTLPVWQLEGQRGTARRARAKLLLRGKRGAAAMTQFTFANLEALLMVAMLVLAEWMNPSQASVTRWFYELDPARQGWVSGAAYALVVLFLEPYYVGAGFAMYLNRRVELEAWDVERELRGAFAA